MSDFKFKAKNPESLPQNTEYQKRFFKVLQSLEEWEIICPKCCASGIKSSIDDGKKICNKCEGNGKITWIENIVNKGD